MLTVISHEKNSFGKIKKIKELANAIDINVLKGIQNDVYLQSNGFLMLGKSDKPIASYKQISDRNERVNIPSS